MQVGANKMEGEGSYWQYSTVLAYIAMQAQVSA